jgi:hypothetical protein
MASFLDKNVCSNDIVLFIVNILLKGMLDGPSAFSISVGKSHKISNNYHGLPRSKDDRRC